MYVIKLNTELSKKFTETGNAPQSTVRRYTSELCKSLAGNLKIALHKGILVRKVSPAHSYMNHTKIKVEKFMDISNIVYK